MTSTLETGEDRETKATPIWEDLIDIIYSPSAVFARRSDGRYIGIALVLSVIFGVLGYVSLSALGPVFDAEFARGIAQAQEQMQASGQSMSAEQIEQMRRIQDIMVVVGSALFLPFVGIVIGAITRVVGALFGAALTLKLAVMVVVYAQIPRLLQQVLIIVQGFLMSPESLTSRHVVGTSPARFMDPETTSTMVMTLAERFDIFTIWATVLIAIGFQVLGKLPRGQAYLAAALVWLIALIPQMLGAVISGA